MTKNQVTSVSISQLQISVVDDDHSMSRMLSRVLTSAGFVVSCFGSAEEFLEAEQSDDPVCLILDMNLPGMSGVELQQKLLQQGCKVPIIFVSADANEVVQQRVLDAGAFSFLSKPFRIESLLANVRAVTVLLLA